MSNKKIFFGFIIGVILTLGIIAALYYLEVFFFKYCRVKICTACDYFIDPGDALAVQKGIKVDEILQIKNNNMFYKRVPQTETCVPSSANRIVKVSPQYCRFRTMNGGIFDGKNMSFGSSLYKGNGFDVITEHQTCNPIESQPLGVVSGEPILRWDANSIPTGVFN